MTSGTAAFPASAEPAPVESTVSAGSTGATPSQGADLRRRLAEFMVVGGATLVLFPLSWLARRTFGLDDAEYAFGFATFYAAFVINDPHFSVTYLLFYKDVKERTLGASYSLAY